MGENVAFRAALHFSAYLNRTHWCVRTLMSCLNALVNALAYIKSYIFLKTMQSLAFIFAFIVRLMKLFNVLEFIVPVNNDRLCLYVLHRL